MSYLHEPVCPLGKRTTIQSAASSGMTDAGVCRGAHEQGFGRCSFVARSINVP